MKRSTPNPTIAFVFNRRVKTPSNYREYYLSRELVRKGFTVYWFYAEPGDNNDFGDTSIQWVRILKNNTMPTVLKHVFYPFYVTWKLKRYGADFVWISGWNERSHSFLVRYVRVLKRSGMKLLYDPIDPIYEYKISVSKDASLDRVRACMNKVYRTVDLTFVPTEALKDLMIENGAPADTLRVAWYGTSLGSVSNFGRTMRDDLPFLSGKFVIGWLGHMSPFKGIEDILIPLIKLLPHKVPNAHFLIGGEGPLAQQLRLLAQQKNLPLTLYGRVDYTEALAFTSILHLYLIPVDPRRPLSNVVRPVKLFDALSQGVPVVTTATPGTLFLQEEFDSILYSDYTVEAFASTIESAVSNYDQLKRHAMQSVHSAVRFGNREIAEKIAGHIGETQYDTHYSSYR